MGHMHADLVRTSSFQTQPQTRVHTEVFHDAIVSDRRFTHRMHRHVSTFGQWRLIGSSTVPPAVI